MERVSALHELGHILGLVQDPTHHRGGHCTNPSCIMYPGTVNIRTVLANFFTGLLGQPKSSFCGGCEEDLTRYRDAVESAPD
jgi:predicted Zn-dependent protease